VRRAVLAVAGLAAGTSLLVVAKGGTPARPAAVAADAGGPVPGGSPTPGPEPTVAPEATTKAPPSPETTARPRPRRSTQEAPPPPPPPQSNTVVGPRVENPYGAVQVVIELDGSRIVDVRTLEMPETEARSQQLSALAEPQLRAEALREQGADLDTVSGATETSESYRRSLRAAIERMKRGERD